MEDFLLGDGCAVKGIFNSESEDVVFLREWRYLNMAGSERRGEEE